MRAPFDGADRFVAPDVGVILAPSLELGMAAFRHEGPLRRSLAALKYVGASRVAGLLAECATPTLDRLLAVSGPATLVPVPVHAVRRRERGYNQAELLAVALGRRSNQPFRVLLERTRPTTKQHRLDRAGRLANLRQAFRVAPGGFVPSRVIVVDDIVTTAATLEACASVLLAAGALEVFGFAIAREV
jgi:ComF family protein